MVGQGMLEVTVLVVIAVVLVFLLFRFGLKQKAFELRDLSKFFNPRH